MNDLERVSSVPKSITEVFGFFLRGQKHVFPNFLAGQLFIILHKHNRSQQETSLLKLCAQKWAENMYWIVLKRLTSIIVLCNS